VRVGTVQLLRRFPLRSAGGEEPAATTLDAAGLAGDRGWAVVDAAGGVLTARQLPWLGGVRAELVPGGPGGQPGLRARVGGQEVSGPALDAELSALVGRPVAVLRADAAGAEAGAPGPSGPHREGAAVHLVSAGAADAPDAPRGFDPGERANVVLALDAAVAPAGSERAWVGRRLRLGGAELVLTRTPGRCLGVYADVLVPGVVRVGDDVLLA